MSLLVTKLFFKLCYNFIQLVSFLIMPGKKVLVLLLDEFFLLLACGQIYREIFHLFIQGLLVFSCIFEFRLGLFKCGLSLLQKLFKRRDLHLSLGEILVKFIELEL